MIPNSIEPHSVRVPEKIPYRILYKSLKGALRVRFSHRVQLLALELGLKTSGVLGFGVLRRFRSRNEGEGRGERGAWASGLGCRMFFAIGA